MQKVEQELSIVIFLLLYSEQYLGLGLKVIGMYMYGFKIEKKFKAESEHHSVKEEGHKEGEH